MFSYSRSFFFKFHFELPSGVDLAGDVSAELTFLLAVLVDVQQTIIALEESRDDG